MCPWESSTLPLCGGRGLTDVQRNIHALCTAPKIRRSRRPWVGRRRGRTAGNCYHKIRHHTAKSARRGFPTEGGFPAALVRRSWFDRRTTEYPCPLHSTQNMKKPPTLGREAARSNRGKLLSQNPTPHREKCPSGLPDREKCPSGLPDRGRLPCCPCAAVVG